MKNDIIIAVSSPSSRGVGVLQKVVADLAVQSKIFKISSIYQVNRKRSDHQSIRSLRSNDWAQDFEVVIWLKSVLTPHVWIEKIKQVEEKHSMKNLNQNVGCQLIFFGDETMMTPQITVPHPEVHRRSVTLDLIAEIWPDKTHPILKKTVYELSQSAKERELGEFFSTGSDLLPSGEMTENETNKES